jgi:hypothetical protein
LLRRGAVLASPISKDTLIAQKTLAIAATAKWSGTSHQTRLNFVETQVSHIASDYAQARFIDYSREGGRFARIDRHQRSPVPTPASNTDPAKTSENTGSNFHHSHHETTAKILVF